MAQLILKIANTSRSTVHVTVTDETLPLAISTHKVTLQLKHLTEQNIALKKSITL